MNTQDIIWRLAQLASLPFQERYIIEGTVDEYVLDTELLENVDGLKFRTRRPENQGTLTNEQFEVLEDLFAYIEKNAEEALSGETKSDRDISILRSHVWIALRAKAANALRAFGITKELSVEEIDRLTE